MRFKTFKIRTFIVNILLFTTLMVFGQSKEIERFNSFLSDLDHNRDFSGVILVEKADNILINREFGFSNMSFDVLNKPNTKFGIASIVKMFTSVSILQLYDEGKVDLDATVGTYLEDFPNISIRDSVTIHHLLTHSSGTDHCFDGDFLTSWKGHYRNLESFTPLYVHKKILFKPGSKYMYNDTGFLILGLIVEAVSGQSYYDYVSENIFRPSKMTQTVSNAMDEVVINRAVGYKIPSDLSKSITTNIYESTKASSAHGIFSTTQDLYKFSKALMNFKLLKESTTRMMLEPKIKGYNTHLGYGIDIDQRGTSIIYGHTGGWYGVRGEVMIFSELDYTVVVLSNYDDNGYQIVSEFFKNYFTSIPEHRELYERTYSMIKDMTKLGWDKVTNEIALKEYMEVDEKMINLFAMNRMYHKRYDIGFNLLKLNVLLFPNSVDALKNLAKCQSDLGFKYKALQNYKSALKLQPNDSSLQQLIKSLTE